LSGAGIIRDESPEARRGREEREEQERRAEAAEEVSNLLHVIVVWFGLTINRRLGDKSSPRKLDELIPTGGPRLGSCLQLKGCRRSLY
jgi:hypothetical protein